MSRLIHAPLPLASLAVTAVLLASGGAQAGPPLICWPFEIGAAAALPWGNGPGWRTPKEDYPRERLVEDTLALLVPAAPVLARMETLRRATIYAAEDPQVAVELLHRLVARTREAEAKGGGEALAWFDAGYLIESYRQARPVFKSSPPQVGQKGYTFVAKALELRGADAEMEFAAALMTFEAGGPVHRGHVRRALAGARHGSLLARNLVSHLGGRGGSLADLRARFGGD